MYFAKVKRIRHIGKMQTYDLSVPQYHNFILGKGIITHNSGKSSAGIMLCKEWCSLLGMKFDVKRHIAYSNTSLMHAIKTLPPFSPILVDESLRFISAEDWAKRENKELKKTVMQIRTKHFLFLMAYPMKIYKVEKTYLESSVNFVIDIIARGKGIIYVPNKNPAKESWGIKDFGELANFNEFTAFEQVEKILKKHPNFWTTIKFPRPSKQLYERYMHVRNRNVYDEESVMATVTQQDICRALICLSLRDIMTTDSTLTMNRIILHMKNEYDINVNKQMIQEAVDDANQLIIKIKEQAIKELN